MATIANILTEIRRRRYPAMTESDGIAYAQLVQDRILRKIPQFQTHAHASPETFPLVIGTKEYSLNALTNQIGQVTMDGASLSPTTIEELNRGTSSGDWRNNGNNACTHYYTVYTSAGLKIGFHPTPSGTQTIKIFGNPFPAVFTATTDNILAGPMLSVFKEGMSYEYALDIMDPAAEIYWAAYENALTELRNWLLTILETFQDGEKTNIRVQQT